MSPIAVALKGKGALSLLQRGLRLVERYGLNSAKLSQELELFHTVTQAFGVRPTFPITSVVLQRHPRLVQHYQALGVEFAIHGYHHVDYSELSADVQSAHLRAACELFARFGLKPKGFRAPYLRLRADTLALLSQRGLRYDASPALAWDVLVGRETPAYRRVLEFFHAQPITEQLSVPSLAGSLVRIPYSLPDDESLVERLGLDSDEQKTEVWLAVLRRSHALGELFTVGLHPERTSLCQQALQQVLTVAHSLSPRVWVATLAEIAEWWLNRSQARFALQPESDGHWRVELTGPPGLTPLVRAATPFAATAPWAEGFQQVAELTFKLAAAVRPVVGLAADTAPAAADFLRCQGYLVERGVERDRCGVYLEGWQDFALSDQRRLLAVVEQSSGPLVRLSRWPGGARSALALTGDIDALTLWDYGLRLLES